MAPDSTLSARWIAVDHIAVAVRDPAGAAQFLAEILDIAPPRPDGPDGDMFRLAIGDVTSLVFTAQPTVASQHIAFRIAAGAFHGVVERLRERGVPFGNDPEQPNNGCCDDPLGGHGRVYFVDRDGHLFEVAA